MTRNGGKWLTNGVDLAPIDVYLYGLSPGRAAQLILEAVFEPCQADLGICAGVYENSLGGRVAVMGYYAWSQLQTLAKSSQVKSLFRWLSRDRLPAYVASYTRTGLWCREDAGGRPAFLLINASLDTAEETELMALTDGAPLILVRTDCGEEILPAAGLEGAYTRYFLSPLKPWEMVMLTGL